METTTIDVDGALESAIVTVSMQGELKGFAPYHGDIITGSVGRAGGSEYSGYQAGPIGPHGSGMVLSEALANAQRYLDEAAYYGSSGGRHVSGTGLFFDRACNVYSGLNFPSVTVLKLQPEPIAQSVSYNTREGTIGYSFSYNNRPPNCYTGALHETINISRNNPSEVHSSLTILGRAKGPILQDIGTVTASTTEVNIEAVIVPAPSGDCTGDLFIGSHSGRNFYSGLLDNVELNISGQYGTFFTTSDSETYDPRTGRYTRSKGWVHTLC